ncbi:kelch-like protein 12 [Ciona intestinalis]
MYFIMIHNFRLKQSHEDTSCDFTIFVGDRKFKAHSLILSASSDYFRAMINSKMKEGIEKYVQIQNVSEQTMENVLCFLYTGNISLCVENVEQLIHAASFMQLDGG